MTETLSDLTRYIGASETVADTVTASAVARLAATLGVDPPGSAPGDALPPGWHAPFFGPIYGADNMRSDGQPASGGIVPPVPLPVRRLRGERSVFHDALRIGDEITQTAEIADITIADGPADELANGPEVTLVIRQNTKSPRGLAVVEEREFFFLEAGASDEAPAPATPSETPWRREIDPDPVLLFRYSAVRFNSHRIHFDRRYVVEHEKLPGLIVHGTLIWQLLLELCRAEAPERPVREFSYRTYRAIYDTGPFVIAGRPAEGGATAELWAIDQAGNVATAATAILGG